MIAPAAPRPAPATDGVFDSEFALLRACCHADRQLTNAALQRELVWEQVFRMAAYHRVLPALYSRLRERPDVPASIQSALSARFLSHCQRVMRFSSELVAILKHFGNQGIPVIAQKGPVLAHLLYGDAAIREFGDLDLLVPAAQVKRAAVALRELRYEKNLRLSSRQEKAYLRLGYEYVFGLGSERNMLELQWNLLPRFYSVDWDVDGLFARSQQHDFEGTRAQVLSSEDQLLFLCVHAAKHQWAQLGMLRDIAAAAQSELDWQLVLAEAGRIGVIRILAISLWLAKSLLGLELRPEVLNQLNLERNCNFVPAIEARLAAGREVPVESAAYFRLMMAVRERWRDRARFAWRLAVTPSVGEWQAVRIPDSLFPLYSSVRCFRLLRRVIG